MDTCKHEFRRRITQDMPHGREARFTRCLQCEQIIEGDAPYKDRPVNERPMFTVSIDKMVESSRETYWVTLQNRILRTEDADIFNRVGIITPYMSEFLDCAELEAYTWAAFLGVTVTPYSFPDAKRKYPNKVLDELLSISGINGKKFSKGES